MIDKRIGMRIKARREELGLSQEELAEKIGIGQHYMSMIERGESFPRCEILINLLNGLETSADPIFRDALHYTTDYKAAALTELLEGLSPEQQSELLATMEVLAKQAKRAPRNNKK